MTVPHSRFEHSHGRRHTLAAATTWFAPSTDGTHRRQPLREEVWGRISPGEPFHLTTAGAGWLFNLALLGERGIAIWGPDPDVLVGPIPAARMRVALRELMEGWRSWLDGAPDLHDLGAQGYM